MQEWREGSHTPAGDAGLAGPVRRRGSRWAVAGIILAATGFAAAIVGALLGLAALAGSALIYAASQGEAGHGRLFREITRVGDFFVVVPLAVAAVACTAAAWRRTRGSDRSRATTIVATVMAACLVGLSIVTALFTI